MQINNLINYLIKQKKICDSCGSTKIEHIHFQDRNETNWAYRNLILFCNICFLEYNKTDEEPKFKGGFISDVNSERGVKVEKDKDIYGFDEFSSLAVDKINYIKSQPKIRTEAGEVVGIFDSFKDDG